jgi:TolB-like protein/Tfp pilus assembly protein PilF
VTIDPPAVRPLNEPFEWVPLPETSNDVFLSYASEDAVAAEKICTALRTAGIKVWFDKRELRGGDAWDASIRQQIKSCTLFVPVISRSTEARSEGYFRLEWKLAVDRTHLMAADQAFLLPIVIDETPDTAARVPDGFHEVHWTRLPNGETPQAFIERVVRLLNVGSVADERATQRLPAARSTPQSAVMASLLKTALLAAIAVIVFALAFLAVNRSQHLQHSPEGRAESKSTAESAVATATATAFRPPPHSIAVLPFANMSGDKDQEYFSDGLTEELLNALSAIDGLQVAARTSAFSFKGTTTDIGAIARKLNVAAVLEGSVRRSAHTIRITAQLINTVTGFNTWSKTYDRDAGDVLKLQTEIAASVAKALQVTLLGDVADKVELGGSNDPAAFDAYLRGAKALTSLDDKGVSDAIAAYTEAIRLDPHYALAYAARSIAFSTDFGQGSASTVASREAIRMALADARQALVLAPDLAQAHLALARVSDRTLDFTRANAEYQRALALSAGNAEVVRRSGIFAASMGHFDAGIAATRRAVVLDPLAPISHAALGRALYFARRYEESLAADAEVISLDRDAQLIHATRGLSFYGLGELEHARASCEAEPNDWLGQQCLAIVYDKLRRHPEAESELAKMHAAQGDATAYQYAAIYAQWGDRAKALDWLTTAWRLKDPGLVLLKTDPLMDPLRQEPRFQTIERQLNFPD